MGMAVHSSGVDTRESESQCSRNEAAESCPSRWCESAPCCGDEKGVSVAYWKFLQNSCLLIFPLIDKADFRCIFSVRQAHPGSGDANSIDKTHPSGGNGFVSQTGLGFESWLTPFLVVFVSRCHSNAP